MVLVLFPSHCQLHCKHGYRCYKYIYYYHYYDWILRWVATRCLMRLFLVVRNRPHSVLSVFLYVVGFLRWHAADHVTNVDASSSCNMCQSEMKMETFHPLRLKARFNRYKVYLIMLQTVIVQLINKCSNLERKSYWASSCTVNEVNVLLLPSGVVVLLIVLGLRKTKDLLHMFWPTSFALSRLSTCGGKKELCHSVWSSWLVLWYPSSVQYVENWVVGYWAIWPTVSSHPKYCFHCVKK